MTAEDTFTERGGVGIRMVLAVVTLAVIGVAIAVALKQVGQRQEANHRKAVRISEYGLQEALQKLQEQPSWREGFNNISCDGGAYTVSLRRVVRNDTVFLAITSEGIMGAVSDVKECRLARFPGSADSAWVPLDMH
jgi:hypothetical protein